jgi:hypothetical protein
MHKKETMLTMLSMKQLTCLICLVILTLEAVNSIQFLTSTNYNSTLYSKEFLYACG